MGKKKIANKFAAVKRMISSQDHRMYPMAYEANKTKPNSNSTTESAGRLWLSRPLTMLKLDSCTLINILVPRNPPACFSHIITHWAHHTGSLLILTSSTFQYKTN